MKLAEESRPDRVCERLFGRLSTWLLVAIAPLSLPLRLVILSPLGVTLGSAVFVGAATYLKLTYLPEMTWRSIAWTSLIWVWLPMAMGYLLLIWSLAGFVPIALWVYGRQWWRGRPLCLREPVVEVSDVTRAHLKGQALLTRDDLLAIEMLDRGDQARLRPAAVICLGLITVVTIVGVAADRLGWVERENSPIPIAMMLSFATALPIVFLLDNAPRPRCLGCGRRLHGEASLAQMIATGACPECGGTALVADRGDKALKEQRETLLGSGGPPD